MRRHVLIPAAALVAVVVAIIAAVLMAPPARAQSRSIIQGQELIDTLTARPLVFVRKQDQQKVSWDVRKDGNLYGRNLSRNSSDKGLWELKSGQFCIHWSGNSVNVCIGLLDENGERFLFTGMAEQPQVFGKVTE